MKVYKKCDIYLIPTKDGSHIVEVKENGKSFLEFVEKAPNSSNIKCYHLYIVYGNQIIASTDRSTTVVTIPNELVAFYCRVNGIDCVEVQLESKPIIIKRYIKDVNWSEILFKPSGINGNTDITFKLCASFRTNFRNMYK